MAGLATAMSDRIAHRGPDDRGVWTDVEAGLALGFRRLAIIDLSETGKQPMISASGRYVISYNGEVYNFQDLRAELEAKGHAYRGHSDTEVLLTAIEEWGVEEALNRANGMFALALWDRKRRELTLARDRVGKKPLYFGVCGKTLLFGSELKALAAHPDFDSAIDPDALGLFMKYAFVPPPRTIYRSIRQLPAGTYITLRQPAAAADAQPRPYWSARDSAEDGARQPFQGSYEEALDALDALLHDAVGGRMVADVDLGAFLSGGIDSSTIVGIMQDISDRPVRTFSIGFTEEKYNEADDARAIAGHLGTDHTELVVTPEDCRAVIPSLATMFDEPFADVSQVPTFLVSKLARAHVTVALSGDGGDELFAGYNSYPKATQRWEQFGGYPHALRRGLAGAMHLAGRKGWDILGPKSEPESFRHSKATRLLAKWERRARTYGAADAVDLFVRRRDRCIDVEELVIGASTVPSILTDQSVRADVTDAVQGMMHLDLAAYLAGDILVKVDRASMATSLEVRCPLLDWRVIDFAWSLPVGFRFAPSGGKRILRDLLDRYVPRSMTDRPKSGFGVPIGAWLRGPLREWAEALIEPGRLRREGTLDAGSVRRIWDQFLCGWHNHEQLMWSILMFQAWHETWQGSEGDAAPVPMSGPAVAHEAPPAAQRLRLD